ncbi:MAG: ABC transporter permease [Gammaproteobacteria bacterium]|nr:ABC transporter permease [Gammaproteobacteria bacterium]MDE0474666.1 ABC transporter permease [Gammaproteobacteria bacterium]MYD00416.1 ABC transporter permease [Gammaproteobacteria bacterium]MYF61499.1 ABC transporter permease [Gammaproteobacteria bacterium]MYI22416.1 ABC transporter permease [Gammaproteobacteria bacterium]
MFANYLAGRIAQLGIVLLLVSVAVFSIMHALPGDPVQLMLSGAESGSVTPERQEQLREEMGLNDPLYVQYGRFLRGAVTADLGTSVRLRAPVLDLILDRLGSTLALSLGGILFAVIIGVTTGVMAALKQGSWIDGFSRVLAYAGVSLPLFWLGLLLILVFAFWLPWFPPAGSEGLRSLVLPSLSLGLLSAGVIARLTRASLLEVLVEDYVRAAWAKGLPKRIVYLRHALRNAFLPVLTILGLQFGAMLAGAVVTETVFSRPGLGRLVVSAILWKDYPLVQGIVLFMATAYVLVNLLVDLLAAWLDPRIRDATPA